jgi:hypothetical protein
MNAHLLADALVVLHLAFIAFAVAGGLLVLWRRWWAVLHLPAVAWSAWTEFTGTLCPLTPWEQSLRQRAGEAGYAEGFVEHYLVPLIYPAALTPRVQIALGIFVLLVNAAIYAGVWRLQRRARPRVDGERGRGGQ